MLVSVILASYNHEKFVKEAVESVLNQTVTDLELIVVDDGSPDKTADVVDKIHDRRLKLVRLNPNRRHYPRNIGIKMARGRYIAFQNSDDVWLKNKLAEQLKVFNSDKKMVVCFTRLDIIDEKGKVLEQSWAKGNLAGDNMNNESWLRLLFEKGINFGIASALIKREAILKVDGFNESMVQMSDYDLWVRLLGHGQIFIVNEKLTQMRIVDGVNYSTPKNEVYWRSALENVDILNRYLQWPVNRYLDEIFFDIMPKDNHLLSVKLATLARYAWTLNTPQHSIFADQLLASLLNDHKSSDEVLSYYGVDIKKEYIKRRGKFEMVIHK